MTRNDLTELQTDPRNLQNLGLILSEEALEGCRNHLESLHNLRYLILLEAHHPQQVKLHLRMMEWHLNNLGEVLLQPYS